MTLISMPEAAALLQPFLGDLNAMNLLTDWRRREPRYRPRVLRKPLFVTIRGAIKYPKDEIVRVIREIALGTAAPAAK